MQESGNYGYYVMVVTVSIVVAAVQAEVYS